MSEVQQCRQVVTVTKEDGLHLRPLSQIVRLAQQYQSEIRILRDQCSVDAKSMLDLMTLNATHGTTLQVQASGKDAAEAVRKLVKLFETGFEEEAV